MLNFDLDGEIDGLSSSTSVHLLRGRYTCRLCPSIGTSRPCRHGGLLLYGMHETSGSGSCSAGYHHTLAGAKRCRRTRPRCARYVFVCGDGRMNSDDIRFVRSAMRTDWEGICSIKVSSTTPQSGGLFFLFVFLWISSRFKALLTSETWKNGASGRKKFGSDCDRNTRKGCRDPRSRRPAKTCSSSSFSLTRMHSS